jgi:Rrf2 family protein
MRLQLTRRGDYAVRVMFALSAVEPGAVLSARSLAAAMVIPARFVTAVLADLVRADLVVARPGRRGGYHLAQPAEQITLLQIIEAIEGDSRRTDCVLLDGACRTAGNGDGPCAVHRFFFAAQEALLNEMRGATLADMRASSGS